jgi:aldose sugar dehydrogenase
LYRFDLNQERNGLILPEALANKIIQTPASPGLENIIFGQGFAGITDVEVGPDGYLYVVSIGQGKIFRIVPGAPQTPPAPLSFPAGEQVPAPVEEPEPAPEAEDEDEDDSAEEEENIEEDDENDNSGLFG